MNTWWSLGRLGGVPIRLHWSALLGAVFFSGLRFAPGAWLGFVLVILVHELGHALVVKASRQHVLRVDIHGFGGECHWVGDATPLQRAAIAWGGVLGQLALGVVALVASFLVGGALGGFGRDLFHALTWTSLWIAALNLIPMAPFDGAEAWKIVPLLQRRFRHRKARRGAAFTADARVVAPRREPARRPGPAARPAARVQDDASKEALRQMLLGVARDAKEARKPRN